MTSASLSTNSRARSLYLHTIKSSIGLMVAFFLLLFLSGPLPFVIQSLNRLGQKRTGSADMLYSSYDTGIYGSGNFALFLFVALAGALVVGLIISSYMHNRQAVDVFGALPVKRERLLLSKLLGGLTILLIPYLLNAAILFGAQGILKAYENSWLLWTVDLTSFFVYAAAVLCITVFCAVNTGTVFDTAMFTLTLCGAPSIVLLLNRTFLSTALIGYSSTSMLNNFILNISPVIAPFRRLLDGGTLVEAQYTVLSLIIWPIAAALIAFFALVLYRRRDNEIAGTSRSGGAIQLLTKLLGADIAGILIALLFSQVLANNWISATLGFLLGAFVAYFIIEAILARGFKTFGRMLLQFACVAAAILVYTGVLYTGGLGYSQRVPDGTKVQSVAIDYGGAGNYFYLKYIPNYNNLSDYYKRDFTDSEVIAQVLKVHEAITLGEGFAQINGVDYDEESLSQKGLLNSSINMTYTLKNGRTLTRTFSKTPIEARDQLYALDGIAAFRAKTSPFTYLRAQDIASVSRADMTLPSLQAATSLTQSQAQALLSALQEDVVNTTQEQMLSPPERELFTLQLNLRYHDATASVAIPEGTGTSYVEDMATHRIFSWNTNTLAVLRDIGWQIDTVPDTSGITGAYLVSYGTSGLWVNGAAYTTEQLGGVVSASDYGISAQELYFESQFRKNEENAQYYKEYAYETGGSQLSDEMVAFLNGYRITDPGQIAQLERASVAQYHAKAGERYYTVAFENAYGANGTGDIAPSISVYIIPESSAPEFLRALQPIL